MYKSGYYWIRAEGEWKLAELVKETEPEQYWFVTVAKQFWYAPDKIEVGLRLGYGPAETCDTVISRYQ